MYNEQIVLGNPIITGFIFISRYEDNHISLMLLIRELFFFTTLDENKFRINRKGLNILYILQLIQRFMDFLYSVKYI